jgi:plasmid stabilization system protein ParE
MVGGGERWLKDVHDYIAQDNPVAAEKVVAGIYPCAQILLEKRHFS